MSASILGGAMALEPEDFDRPVRDYIFDEGGTAGGLIDAMSQSGGFSATKLATARDLLIELLLP